MSSGHALSSHFLNPAHDRLPPDRKEHVMSLQEKLDAFKAQLEAGGPPYNVSREEVDIMHRATDELRLSRISDRALRVGDRAPDFVLPDYEGKPFDSRAARRERPLVVSFYRGVW
jgi:hypothetical protein